MYRWLAVSALLCLWPSLSSAQEPAPLSSLSTEDLWRMYERNSEAEQRVLIEFYASWLTRRMQVSEHLAKLTAEQRRSRGLELKLTRAEQQVRDLRRQLATADGLAESLQETSKRQRSEVERLLEALKVAETSARESKDYVMSAALSLPSYGVGGFLTDAAICAACGAAGFGIRILTE